MKWKMKTGQSIEISDMTDSHVINTYKFLQKKEKEIAEEISAGWNCLGFFQGEMAEYYCSQELDHLYNRELRIQYWLLVFDKELEKRKLK